MSMVEVQPSAPAGMTMTPPPRKRVLPGWAIFALGIVAVVGVLATTSYLTGQPALTSSSTMQNTVTLGLPILLCGLGGIWAERSGMINIGLEGMMILGTWGAAWAGVLGLGPYGSVLFGAVFGAVGGVLHAIATVSFGVNHIVSGVAINLLGAGVAKYLSTLIFEPLSDNPRDSPPIERFDTFSAPGLSDWLGDLESQQRAVISDVAGLLVIWQLFRRKWLPAAFAAIGAVAVYVLYFATDELPTEFLPYTPHIITLVVLALAAQRLRPPAADGIPYRRGEGD
jgi:simple sugar transport system permease protein